MKEKNYWAEIFSFVVNVGEFLSMQEIKVKWERISQCLNTVTVVNKILFSEL